MTDDLIPAPPIDLARESDFSLGALLVRPSVRTVEFDSTREVLEPRVMQVLVALAQAQGGVVSRDDLIARCWEGRIVGEDAINRAIGRLRKLAEAGDGRTFRIETVARVGYRLEPGGDSAMPVAASSVTELPAAAAVRPSPAGRVWWIAAGSALAFAALAVAAVLWWPRAPEQWSIDSFRMIASAPTYENDPALAPNGTMIAYSAGPAPFARHIFMRNLSNGEPIQLTSGPNDNDIHPAWSPGSDSIAFVRHRENMPCAIVVKPVPAGDERIVGHCQLDDFAALDWSPKGDALYFADRASSRSARQLMRLDLASGEIRAITHPPNEIVGDRDAVSSPDGTKLAFVRRGKGGVHSLILDLASGEIHPLPVPDIPDLHPDKAWIDNDTLIASAGGLTAPALWILPLHGTPQHIGANTQELGLVAAGPNGTFAVETIRDQTVLASPPGADGGAPVVLQAASGNAILPQYSATGVLVFAHASPGGLFEIWIQNPGEQPHRIGAVGATYINGLSWSPDGKRLMFYALIGKQRGITLMNADGTGLRLLNRHGTTGMPAWAADGESLFLPIKDAEGWRIWRMSIDKPEQIVPVSPHGWFAVRTAGSAIYAMGPQPAGIWRIDGKPAFVARFRRRCTDAFLECQTWSISGDTLVFADQAERAMPQIVLHSLKDGTERIVPAPGLDYSDEIALDPVTGKLLYVYDGLGDSDIALFHLTKR